MNYENEAKLVSILNVLSFFFMNVVYLFTIIYYYVSMLNVLSFFFIKISNYDWSQQFDEFRCSTF